MNAITERMIKLANEKERYPFYTFYMKTERRTESLKKMDWRAAIFISALHRITFSKNKVRKKQVDAILEMPLAKALPTKDSFPNKDFQQIFLKANTALQL